MSPPESKLEAELAAVKKELAAKVKHYEGKLVTLTVINGALQSENEKLKEELAMGGGGAGGTSAQELQELHAEFTRRLGAAEKTAHSMREECFSLRRTVDDLRRTQAQLQEDVAERDLSIEQYNAEGQSLARKLGDSEATVAKLRGEAARLEQETERLQARVQVLEAAAESVEASKAAVLEGTKSDLAALQRTLQEQKEQYKQLLDEMRAKQERAAAQHQEQLRELRQQAAQELREREMMLQGRFAALQQSLADSERQASFTEDNLRQEIQRLTLHCRATEEALSEAQASISEAARPLVKQMEAVLAQERRLEAAVREQEQQLQEERSQHQEEVQGLREKVTKAQNAAALAEARIQRAEETARAARAQLDRAEARMTAAEAAAAEAVAKRAEALERASCAEDAHREALEALSAAKRGNEEAENKTSLARVEAEMLLQQLQQLQAQPLNGLVDDSLGGRAGKLAQVSLGSPADVTSPAVKPRPGRSNASPWPDMDSAASDKPSRPFLLQASDAGAGEGSRDSSVSGGDDGGGSSSAGIPLELATPPRSDAELSHLGEGNGSGVTKVAVASGAAVFLEQLSSKVKLLQGELEQLRKELRATKAGQEHAEERLLKAEQKILADEKAVQRTATLEADLAALRKRHDTALVLIGERNERVEELEADIADVRTLYKEQVNLLINQVDPSKWPNGYRICPFCAHCMQQRRQKMPE